MEFAKTLKVRLTLTEEALGTSPSDPELYDRFIASNAPDAPTRAEEIAEHGVGDVAERARTVFNRMEDGTPYFYNYHIKGFFKDSCKMLLQLTKREEVTEVKSDGTTKTKKKSIPSNQSGKAFTNYNYKTKIDGLVFVFPRRIPIIFRGGMGDCQRSLRADTMQGPRVALASSDTVPAGATLTFDICLMDAGHEAAVREWLNYGEIRGLGQWRNSGKGCFLWEELDGDGNVIGGNRKG